MTLSQAMIGGVDGGRGAEAEESRSRLVARQPIFDASLNLYGYEILYRSGPENLFRGDPDAASRQVLDTMLGMAYRSPVEQPVAFINCTRETLVEQLVTLLPAQSTVLEVLESVVPDGEVMEACRDLRDAGYRLALDDFAPDDARLPLLELADFVKVDFRACDAAARRRVYELASRRRVRLVAEKIEDEQELQQARHEGCTFFQGYFFARPAMLETKRIPQDRTLYLRLLSELCHVPLRLREIERVVMQEASLCYRLLRMVNSARYGQRNKVTSVRSAILLAGEMEFRKLVTIALAGEPTPRSRAVVSLALQRACFCELLAPMTGQNPDEQYLIGMLSLMPALLRIPMEQLVEGLPLDEPARQALLGANNGHALPLAILADFEQGRWQECERRCTEANIVSEGIEPLYAQSVTSADAMLDEQQH
ncbi:EAL and HDOD domain-containing protein [Paracidobacterium acidisoli]|nr:EAL domain-containing protein [Paracidobacterium acidisoli]MBT9332908.1 EAL domain-containing protein [Paracidobacterium acidisoli]